MFLISRERCPKIIEGFATGYRYKRKKDGQYEEVPEKNEHSHPHDATQYGAMVVDTAGDLARALNRVREVQPISLAGWT